MERLSCIFVCHSLSLFQDMRAFLLDSSSSVGKGRVFGIQALLAVYKAKSTRRLEYPHSLSYQEITLWKLSLRQIPAVASTMELRAS
mmetsp:Transcript_2036/g.5622  ORF Transcript_2036/g.5622 Transcript_2036/m.5622 type:complete len:87 (-) Transcript_2036:145-405(-)